MQAPQIDILKDMAESRGSPLDFTEQQKNLLRTVFADRDVGLWFWCWYIFGFTDLRWDLHGPICQFLGHWGESTLDDGSVITGHPGVIEERVVDCNRRLMLRIPRETFKTSIGSRATPTWLLFTQSVEYTFGIFNEKEENPVSWINVICNVIGSSLLLQTLYPEYIPKGISIADRDKGISKPRDLKWGGSGIVLNRNSTGVSELSIEPHGIGGATTGKHFTHMVWDDLIGRAAAKSPAIMAEAVDFVENSRPLERPAEGGAVLVNHTRWAYGDVYAWIEKQWPGEYKLLHRALLEHPVTRKPDVVGGVSIFPEKISTKKAKKMYETNAYNFSGQYQNTPMAGKTQMFSAKSFGSFHLHWLNKKDPALYLDSTGWRDGKFDAECLNLECGQEFAPQIVPYSYCSRAIILDPVPSKDVEKKLEPEAENGICVVAMDPWGRMFNLESLKTVAPTVTEERDAQGEYEEDVLGILIDLARRWAATTVAIESVNFSAVYGPLFNRIIRHDPRYKDVRDRLVFMEVFTKGRQKNSRIFNNLDSDFNSGLWYFNMIDTDEQRHLGPTAYVRQEIQEFPFSTTKDIVDAMSYTNDKEGVPVLTRPHSPEEKEVLARRLRRRDSDRGVTGYGQFT